MSKRFTVCLVLLVALMVCLHVTNTVWCGSCKLGTFSTVHMFPHCTVCGEDIRENGLHKQYFRKCEDCGRISFIASNCVKCGGELSDTETRYHATVLREAIRCLPTWAWLAGTGLGCIFLVVGWYYRKRLRVEVRKE